MFIVYGLSFITKEVGKKEKNNVNIKNKNKGKRRKKDNISNFQRIFVNKYICFFVAKQLK